MIPTRWKAISAQRYLELLEILPPLDWSAKGFLVGEAVSHTEEGATTFTACAEVGDRYFESTAPITRAQFRALTAADVLGNVESAEAA